MLMWLVGDFMAAAQHNQGALHCIFLAKDKIQICSLVSTEGVSRLYSHEAERLYSKDHLYSCYSQCVGYELEVQKS